MKNLYTLIFILLIQLLSFPSFSQGCVAVRNLTPGTAALSNEPKTWLFSLNYRYFRSFRHFVGTEEQTQRLANHTEVINYDNSIILGGNYTLSNRWSFSAAIPFLYIDRSSLYEHYGNTPLTNPRFHTQSQGLGDVRLMGYYQLARSDKFRLQIGAGFKLPTGKNNFKDYFHKLSKLGSDSLVYKVVDQSIQPGDGGVGAIVEYNLNKSLSTRVVIYSNGSYLFNPRNTNGILRSPSPGTIPLSNEFSVSDQFFARLGVQYEIKSFAFAVGGRVEGIPSRDIIGREDGFRRPGYIISMEPSIYFSRGNHIFGLNVPVALVRNRTQSSIDRMRSIETGQKVHGDAAFADYLISVSYIFRLNAKPLPNPFGAPQEHVK